jgi:hypothetical protein
MPVYTEEGRMRFETAVEIVGFVVQCFAFVYPIILYVLLYHRPLRHPIMSRITWAMVTAGLGYNITVMLYDWVFPTSNVFRMTMLWCGTSSVLLAAIQQLEIMKAFVLLSEKLKPNQISIFQIFFSVFIMVISVPSLFEDIVAVSQPSLLSIFAMLGSYVRSFHAMITVVITNFCSVYMLKLVYANVNKKTNQRDDQEVIVRNFKEAIVYIVLQIVVDLVGCSVFVNSALSPSTTYEEQRISLSFSRMASSLLLLRSIFQYLVFLGIMKVKFYKQSTQKQSMSKKSQKNPLLKVKATKEHRGSAASDVQSPSPKSPESENQ